MSGVLSTGTSALLAFQRALSTVGHNVANAATPGYSRQRVDLASRPGTGAGQIQIGAGVDVAKLQRLADGLVFARQVDSSGEVGRLQQLSSLSGRVDSLVTDRATGLAQPWSAFFAASQGVSAEPTSTVARSEMLNAAEQLAGRWRALDSQLGQMGSETNQRMSAQVGEVNRLATEIAKYNVDIVSAGANPSPDLLDARALRVEQLASLVGASAVPQDDGALNVFTGGGQPIVLGAKASTLATVADPYRPDRMQLALAGPNGTVQLPADSVSGEIGGLLEFRNRVLDPARGELGRLATAFATEFNAVQRSGIDFNGNPGADIFSLRAPPTDPHSANTGSATLTASVGDVGALQAADLVLRYDGASWSANRADTGAPVAMTGAGTSADPLRVAGINLTVAGAANAGDRFALSPTAGAAGGLQLVMRDANGIAAASPLQARADTANLGTARVGSTQVTNAATFAGFTGATVEFIDAAQYTVDGAGPYPYSPGSPIASGGWSLTLDGTPSAGDSFALSPTPPRSADNGNARTLAAFDHRRLLDGRTATLTEGMGQLTARVGSQTRHSELSLEAQNAIHTQVTAERESVSGVNLDEEAADLMRYQQAYQAAAQVISTADTLFQSLLGAIRR
ncbi:MAG: Flagellar hook-associated protein FlgK [uncultured Lysobacter sp.]|uniref:Flagellar hook-associated protein 1 n=1 Tax=uncultured Lysobacter sp. TaxID=271060 RepID=A0A6J4LRC5_9GAMM|nr:MAG: Flagellar hook-associated protein FlgK [uncultured Lysobacter sp.]